jgi:4-hydroxy-tetrahydrodipicolinate reductase
MRLAIIGDGKMARAIAELSAERGHEVVAMLGPDQNRGGSGISVTGLNDPQVAMEFTEPDSAVANAVACVRAGVPVVIGTTGWYANLPVIVSEAAKSGTPVLWAPNFSLGIAVLAAAVELVGTALRGSSAFDVHLVETHHAAKKDRPSGTAAMLASETGRALGRAVEVTSVRVGHVPGTHEIIFDAPFEQLRFVHEARDRRVFADGALRAAEWLRQQRGGRVFTMKDVVNAIQHATDGGV